MKQKICMAAAICIAIAGTLLFSFQRAQEVEAKVGKTQQALAEEVFRFHVVADSDSREDQAIKQKVRDAVLEAKNVVRAEGKTYGASAEVVTCYFPDKRYGDLLFPAGRYRALRITLGTGAGHNWWCVLYPSLCFTDPVCAVVDEEGKEELEEALTAEEYEMITASTKFRIKWFFLGDSSDD